MKTECIHKCKCCNKVTIHKMANVIPPPRIRVICGICEISEVLPPLYIPMTITTTYLFEEEQDEILDSSE